MKLDRLAQRANDAARVFAVLRRVFGDGRLGNELQRAAAVDAELSALRSASVSMSEATISIS